MKCVLRINISCKIRIYCYGHFFLYDDLPFSETSQDIANLHFTIYTRYINITKSKTTHLKEEKSQMSKTTTQLLPYLVTTIFGD